MYGINARLPKTYFNCEMCGIYKLQGVYIWGSFGLPYYYEKRICKACAIREHGRRNKLKLEDVINERTERWLKKEKQKQK